MLLTEMEPRQGIDVTQAFRSHGDSESTLLLTQDPDVSGVVSANQANLCIYL